jgi:hypothetical protein
MYVCTRVGQKLALAPRPLMIYYFNVNSPYKIIEAEGTQDTYKREIFEKFHYPGVHITCSKG